MHTILMIVSPQSWGQGTGLYPHCASWASRRCVAMMVSHPVLCVCVRVCVCMYVCVCVCVCVSVCVYVCM